jgi:hypothetical protein
VQAPEDLIPQAALSNATLLRRDSTQLQEMNQFSGFPDIIGHIASHRIGQTKSDFLMIEDRRSPPELWFLQVPWCLCGF